MLTISAIDHETHEPRRRYYVARRIDVTGHDCAAVYHRAHAIHELAALTGMDPAQGYTAALLGARILRAQRRDIAAQCTCGGLRHHRATCPAVALCSGCLHD